jgi:hypothetical protein
MPSSYVYLTGSMDLRSSVGPGGAVTVSFSDNNGLDWKKVTKIETGGPQKIDLAERCFRRYDYRLKFEMEGAGTGLDALSIRHDIQHAQTPLPMLFAGKNTITFSAGPAEGTITVEGHPNPAVLENPKIKGKPLLLTDFHPVLENMKPGNSFRVQAYGPPGIVTFPIETPGDITRVRLGADWRARDRNEGWKMLLSFDDGQTWKEVGEMPGPMKGAGTYVTADEVPEGARKVLARFQSSRMRNTLCLFNLRIDADYRMPNAGFRPVKITYTWDEGGERKENVHVAKRANETYTITCAKQPIMKSLVVELAD